MTTLHRRITRRTNTQLDGSFGPDRGRNLVVSLDAGDLLRLRPIGTRREEVLSLLDAYRYAIRCRINRGMLEKARDRKLRLKARRETQQLDSAERRLRNSAKKDEVFK